MKNLFSTSLTRRKLLPFSAFLVGGVVSALAAKVCIPPTLAISGTLGKLDQKAGTLTLRQPKSRGLLKMAGPFPEIDRKVDGDDYLVTYRLSNQTTFLEWPSNASSLARVEKFVGKEIIVMAKVGNPSVIQVKFWSQAMDAKMNTKK